MGNNSRARTALTATGGRRFFWVGAVALIAAFGPAHRAAAELILNGDFSAGNTGFGSDYSFIPAPSTSVTPGTFAIRTNPQAFNAGLAAFGDHTTGTGNMMVVDGSAGRVWTETVSVVPNAPYFLSAWIASASSSNLATLRFSINGTQVGSDFALPSTAGLWQNFSTTWNAGASTSATLTVADMNPTPLLAGNDFALDDISFVPEPSAIVLLLGLAGMGVLAYRIRRRS
jgi:hypothetical protein